MCPLRLVFLARTTAPAKLLLEQPKCLFDLLPMGVIWQRTSNFRHDELNIVRKLAIKAEAYIDDLVLEGDTTE